MVWKGRHRRNRQIPQQEKNMKYWSQRGSKFKGKEPALCTLPSFLPHSPCCLTFPFFFFWSLPPLLLLLSSGIHPIPKHHSKTLSQSQHHSSVSADPTDKDCRDLQHIKDLSLSFCLSLSLPGLPAFSPCPQTLTRTHTHMHSHSHTLISVSSLHFPFISVCTSWAAMSCLHLNSGNQEEKDEVGTCPCQKRNPGRSPSTPNL